jgi:hypothetical protein
MKKLFLMGVAIFLATCPLHAQTAEDALRYSRIDFNGTARFTGLSGAFGALGADFSTAATNPAGIGLYRGSELTFTIAPHIGYSSATYNGSTATDSRGNFGLGNFGMVFSMNTENNPKYGSIKNFNFGFGFNRQNDFNNRVFIHGSNMKNSLMQSYTNILNNGYTPPDMVGYNYPFDIGLAYNANLVFYDSATARYYCDAEFGGVMQDKEITTSGSITELDFSFAANLGDKLYLGLTVGIPTLNYYEYSHYKEYRIKDTVPNFRSLDYFYDLHTRGTGVNAKFGAIYKPVKWVRIGAAVHTPTWYPSMSDSWSSSMQSSFDSTYWNNIVYSPLGYYDYKLTTPFRAMGSLAFIIGSNGVVSADYEYVNYSQARFNSSGDSYTDVNNQISSSYKSYGNFRFGTEWCISDFRLRGGMAYFSNPYVKGSNNMERIQFSAGAGYRQRSFFVDLTYVYSKMNQSYYLYDPSMVNPAEISTYSHSFNTTIGFRF